MSSAWASSMQMITGGRALGRAKVTQSFLARRDQITPRTSAVMNMNDMWWLERSFLSLNKRHIVPSWEVLEWCLVGEHSLPDDECRYCNGPVVFPRILNAVRKVRLDTNVTSACKLLPATRYCSHYTSGGLWHSQGCSVLADRS